MTLPALLRACLLFKSVCLHSSASRRGMSTEVVSSWNHDQASRSVTLLSKYYYSSQSISIYKNVLFAQGVSITDGHLIFRSTPHGSVSSVVTTVHVV